MILRAATLTAGLAGAAGMSQFPEYSQQYVRRLGGAVDELARVVDEFDRDAQTVGTTREQALADLAKGGAIGAERSATMSNTIDRHTRLSADLETLTGAGPFTRASQALRFRDSDVARRALENYKPAIPLTFEGAVFGGFGLLVGMTLFAALVWLVRLPFRRAQPAS